MNKELVIKYNKDIWKQQKCLFVDTLQIFITDRCNKRCTGCFNDARLGKDDMSLDQYKKIVDEYQPHIKKVILMGGEPTMHKNLAEMIKINQNNRLRTTIYTNGSFMNVFDDIDLMDVTIRVGVMGLNSSEKRLIDVKSNVPFELTYMLRRDNYKELNRTIDYAEKLLDIKRVMLSSIRNIGDSGDYWVDGAGDLSHEEYFNVAQNFINSYNGKLREIQISIRGDMSIEGGDYNRCRFMNIFPNGDRIICPFDICKNKTETDLFTFSERKCNKNHKCLLQKVILKRI
jgi:MoaA/NifB/PqqE/SkfB family radical SAM enzyme